MGYGYGVWLVVQDFNIQRMVRKYNTKPHIAHITVMCNMNDTDAFKLARELKGTYSGTILNRYVHFNKNSDKYSHHDNDNLAASGYYCIVDKWREITETIERHEVPLSCRDDVIARVFRAKLKQLLHDLIKLGALGMYPHT